MFSSLTGNPLTDAASSSNVSKNISLKKIDTTVTTTRVTAPTTYRSVVSNVYILPNK
ncbi:hypothetical protein D1872_325240 [compost metagenome]